MAGAQHAAATVLIVWEHGGNLGHLGRLLPAMQAVLARGARVVFAAARTAEVGPYVQALGVAAGLATGVSVVQAPLTAPPPPLDDVPICPAEVWLRCGFSDPSGAQECVRQWLALFDAVRPAAVLVDASPMALYAANVAGISTVAIGHGFELPPAGAGMCFAPWQVGLAGRVAASEEALAVALDDLARTVKPAGGLAGAGPSFGAVGDVLGAATQALCVWPELDHFDRSPSSVPYLGPIWHMLPGAHAVRWPDKAGPKVLCYLTLANKRYDLLWQALQQQGANVVVVSPGAADWLCEQVRGWGMHVCAEPIALGAALQECSAVIGHGGLGLTSMALQAGKPLMLLPSQLEQGLLAYQLVRRGLAITSMSFLNKRQMQSRVAQLLQDALLQARAAQFGARYAGFDPGQPVQKIVAMLLGTQMQDTKKSETTPC